MNSPNLSDDPNAEAFGLMALDESEFADINPVHNAGLMTQDWLMNAPLEDVAVATRRHFTVTIAVHLSDMIRFLRPDLANSARALADQYAPSFIESPRLDKVVSCASSFRRQIVEHLHAEGVVSDEDIDFGETATKIVDEMHLLQLVLIRKREELAAKEEQEKNA